jgi:hypothetical protein
VGALLSQVSYRYYCCTCVTIVLPCNPVDHQQSLTSQLSAHISISPSISNLELTQHSSWLDLRCLYTRSESTDCKNNRHHNRVTIRLRNIAENGRALLERDSKMGMATTASLPATAPSTSRFVQMICPSSAKGKKPPCSSNYRQSGGYGAAKDRRRLYRCKTWVIHQADCEAISSIEEHPCRHDCSTFCWMRPICVEQGRQALWLVQNQTLAGP